MWDSNPHISDAGRAWLARMRARVDELTSDQAIDDWLVEAIENGIDPL